MEQPTNFYDLGKHLVLSEAVDENSKFGHYLNSPGPAFAIKDFRQLAESLKLPTSTKAFTAAKQAFERGWKDGQVERFQENNIIKDAVVRAMHERTVRMIAKERKRIAQELFS